MTIKDQFTNYIHSLQNEICTALENEDGKATFLEDVWERDGGGGGITKVISNGAVIEKGGVNTSVVYGKLNEAVRRQLHVNHEDFFACGLSIVIHPQNPFSPTIHMNVRFFEMYDEEGTVANQWFGGGIDLTPYYLNKEHVLDFHNKLKASCDAFDSSLYPKYKKRCDEYFYNSHRSETRGVGGIFYDKLDDTILPTMDDCRKFSESIGNTFCPIYLPILKETKGLEFSASNKYWQEIRRGRYVEFNLIHDKGTHFGLKTNGRTESILMSLPPTVRWDYAFQPEKDSKEYEMLQHLTPTDWLELNSKS